MSSNRYAKALLFLLFIMTGCGQTRNETDPKVTELEIDAVFESETAEELEATMSDSESLLDAFLASQIPAVYDDGRQEAFIFEDFQCNGEDWDTWSVGERVDLDNDGENEQILNGPYGGWYLDARNQNVYILAQGEGTSGELSYVYYDDAVWIVHRDITHVGRQMFWMTRYDGNGKIADEIQLSAEYWESSDYLYHEDSDFTFGEDKISMEEYERLRKEIFGW